MALSLFKDVDDHISSAEDLSQNVEDDDDIVFISDRNSRLEISSFEDLGDGGGATNGQQQQAPNSTGASMPFKSLVPTSTDYFKSFEFAFLRGSMGIAAIKNEMIRGTQAEQVRVPNKYPGFFLVRLPFNLLSHIF